MPPPLDSDEWAAREARRPSRAASAALDEFIRGGRSVQADDDQEDEARDNVPPAAMPGGFDGGAGGRGSFVGAGGGASFELGAEVRGALIERRERQVHRGGGSVSRPRGANGV